MKKEQLQELVRLITKAVLKEYTSMQMGGKDEAETNAANQDNALTIDDLPPAAKAKMLRDKEKAKQDQIKQKSKELDIAKKKLDYQKQETDGMKRFEIPNITKDIQRLKGAKI